MKKFIVLVLTGICLFGSNARAALMSGSLSYTGSTSGEMLAINAFQGNPFNWSIDYDSTTQIWTYTYSFKPSGTNRGPSFINLETAGDVGDLATSFSYTTAVPSADILATLTPASAQFSGIMPIDYRINTGISVAAGNTQVDTDPLTGAKPFGYQAWIGTMPTAQAVNVNSIITGVRVSVPSRTYGMANGPTQAGLLTGYNAGGTTYQVVMMTRSAPMWGRFYLDGGDWTSHNGWLMAYNREYDNPTRPTFVLGSNQSGWIAVPGPYSGSVSNLGITTQPEFDNATLKGVSNAWATISRDPTDRGVTLSWTVEPTGAVWKYSYTLYGAVKATDKWVQNIDLETPAGFKASDVFSGWTLFRSEAVVATQPTPADQIVSLDVSSSSAGPSDAAPLTEAAFPGGSLTGIRWTIPNAPAFVVKDAMATMFTLSFTSDYAPAWGSFIVTSGGTSGAGQPTVWNSKIGQTSDAPVTGGNNGGWILVPGKAPDQNPATPPTVIFTTPAEGATGVAPGSVVTATLSQDLDPATINGTTFTVNGISGTVGYDAASRVATFSPGAALSYATTYTVTLTSGIRNLAGDAMDADKTWSFTTAAPPDVTPPSVLSVTPTNGTKGVAIKSPLVVVFSEPIDPATIDGATMTVSDSGGKPVNGTVAYNAATTTLTFAPLTPLAYFSNFTATISGGIRDLAGNPLGAAMSWSFTTEALAGDLDGGGCAPALKDALLALRIVVGLVVPTEYQIAACDVAPLVNGKPHPDGKINVGDALVILRRVVGLDSW